MQVLKRTRHATSAALSGTASVLVNAGRLVKVAADAVRPDDPAAVDTGTGPGAVAPPPRVPAGAPDDPLLPSRARTSPSNVVDLAERPASEVIAQVEALSTDELRLRLEHEQSHRHRTSVLAAIERAAAQHVP